MDTAADRQGTWLSDRTLWDSRVDRVRSGREWGPAVDSVKSGPTWCCQDTLCGNLAAPPVEIRSLYSQPLRVGWDCGWLGQEGLYSEASEALRDSAQSSGNWPGQQSKPVWLTRGEEIAWRRSQVPQQIPATQKKGLPRQPQWTSERRESPAENTWIT